MSIKKNYSHLKWDSVEESATGSFEEQNMYRKKLRRTQIPGGWLVESEVYDQQAGFGVGLTFVADADHAWQLEE